MFIDLAHFIFDLFKGKSETQDIEQLEELLLEIQYEKQKTDRWIKINTILLTLILVSHIPVIIILISNK